MTGDAETEPRNVETTMVPVRPLSAEHAVTDALRRAILSGALAPGLRLSQQALAEQLGVSRIPLRDALRRLEEEALVRIDGRRGAWVTTLDARDIAEIYELRILLEAQCIHHVVENVTDDDVTELARLAKEMDAYDHDPVVGRQARRDFYEAMYERAQRPRMSRVILQLRDNVGRYHILSDVRHSHEAHAAIVECLKKRDGDGASRIICEHLETARDDLLESMMLTDK